MFVTYFYDAIEQNERALTGKQYRRKNCIVRSVRQVEKDIERGRSYKRSVQKR